jgi:hypothetical protein
MGTHSLYPDTWPINGVIRQDDILQGSLFRAGSAIELHPSGTKFQENVEQSF